VRSMLLNGAFLVCLRTLPLSPVKSGSSTQAPECQLATTRLHVSARMPTGNHGPRKTEDPDQGNHCVFDAPERSICGVSSDPTTFNGGDRIEHASTRMPTGNHGPCDPINTPTGALNRSRENNVGSGAVNSTCGHPNRDTTSTDKGAATLIGQADQGTQPGQLQTDDEEYQHVRIDKTCSRNINEQRTVYRQLAASANGAQNQTPKS